MSAYVCRFEYRSDGGPLLVGPFATKDEALHWPDGRIADAAWEAEPMVSPDTAALAAEAPIPWQPNGQLWPAPGRTGEWHDIPDDGHDFDNCPCGPELRVNTSDGQLRSVWVHQRRADAPH